MHNKGAGLGMAKGTSHGIWPHNSQFDSWSEIMCGLYISWIWLSGLTQDILTKFSFSELSLRHAHNHTKIPQNLGCDHPNSIPLGGPGVAAAQRQKPARIETKVRQPTIRRAFVESRNIEWCRFNKNLLLKGIYEDLLSVSSGTVLDWLCVIGFGLLKICFLWLMFLLKVAFDLLFMVSSQKTPSFHKSKWWRKQGSCSLEKC